MWRPHWRQIGCAGRPGIRRGGRPGWHFLLKDLCWESWGLARRQAQTMLGNHCCRCALSAGSFYLTWDQDPVRINNLLDVATAAWPGGSTSRRT
jgi:hypothetical protein